MMRKENHLKMKKDEGYFLEHFKLVADLRVHEKNHTKKQ